MGTPALVFGDTQFDIVSTDQNRGREQMKEATHMPFSRRASQVGIEANKTFINIFDHVSSALPAVTAPCPTCKRVLTFEAPADIYCGHAGTELHSPDEDGWTLVKRPQRKSQMPSWPKGHTSRAQRPSPKRTGA